MTTKTTLCTYTYNDTPFVNDLLKHIPSWTCLPDKIVIVDDGSQSPFSLADIETILPIEIIRSENNQGIPTTKSRGISSATTDYIFSIDCDTRVSPNYLERCLEHVKKLPQAGQKIGLVSGEVRYDSGKDLVSRYLRYFGDNHNLNQTGAVDFIPGNAFLIPRATWKEVGGFGNFKRTSCEDHELCSRLKQRGYELFSDCSINAWQTRRISRGTLCARIWDWCHQSLEDYLVKSRNYVPEYIYKIIIEPMLERIDIALQAKEPLFIYIEMLYFLFATSQLLYFGTNKKLFSDHPTLAFQSIVQTALAPHPRLNQTIHKDLTQAGTNDLLSISIQTRSSIKTDMKEAWDLVSDFIDFLSKSGYLKWLNNEGVTTHPHHP